MGSEENLKKEVSLNLAIVSLYFSSNILVNSPTYIGATNKTIGLERVNAYFDSIAAVYNTVYWNYNENYDLCNDTVNFCVSVHMNPEATHRFSVDFAEGLK